MIFTIFVTFLQVNVLELQIEIKVTFAHTLLVTNCLKVLDNDLSMRNVPIYMEFGEIKVDSYVLDNMS